MGRCARRTKKTIKIIAKQLTPFGVRYIGDLVAILAGTDFDDSGKREIAFQLAKSQFRIRGVEAKENAIRAAVEHAVAVLKQGAEALEDLGMEDEDTAEVEILDA